MDEVNQDRQRIITLFPAETTDGGWCWVAAVPSCEGLYAQGNTPTEALRGLAEVWDTYEHHYDVYGEPMPPELYTLIEKARGL